MYRRTAHEDQRPASQSCNSDMPHCAPCVAPPILKQWPDKRDGSRWAAWPALRMVRARERVVMGRFMLETKK